MDPLSISASIAGLVTLADLVFRSATKYVKGVTGSRKEVDALSREVKNLSLVLHHLSLVAFDLESQTTTGGTATEQASHFKAHHLHDCQQVLRRLEKGLCDTKSSLESGSCLDRLQSRLKWPFSSTETKEILEELQRHKQTIDLALAAESLIKLKLSLSRQAEANDGIKKVQLSVEQLLDMQTKQDLDRNEYEVLGAFAKVNPRPEFDTNRKLRHHLTGLWLTEGPDFENWYITPGSKIWCSGIPGAGKSVLAAAIIEECLTRNGPNPGPAVAYFFCTYRDPRTQEPVTILSSLCAQLASQNKDAFRILKGYHDELRSNRHFPADPSVKGLIKVVHDMCASFTQVYLIVDGLDECGDDVEASVGSLVDLASSPSDETVNLALLSRDEASIRERVGPDFRNIEIEAHTEDVQHYVATELEQRISSRKLRLRNLGLKDQIMTRLTSGAKGMFRWVACQLDHICELPTDRARQEALDKLPPTLPATYERILMRIDGKNEEWKRLLQTTILLISAPAPERLSFAQICEAVSLRHNSDSLYEDEIVEKGEILRLCGSLVRTSKDGSFIEFAHFSVQEYLQGDCLNHPTLGHYGVSSIRAYSALGPLCLRFLTLKNHERLPEATEREVDGILERRQLRPFYEHAAIYWPHYVNGSSTSSAESHYSEQLHDLFQLPKSPSFCAWAIELIRHCLVDENENYFPFQEGSGFRQSKREAIEVITAVLRPDFTPLHMAAALGMPDLCRHLLEKGANVGLRGKFGTPFHCAIGSLRVFTNLTNISWHWNGPGGFLSPLARRQTVQLLLEAGSTPELRLTTPFFTTTLVCLATFAGFEQQGDPHDMETAADLIRLGVHVGEKDYEAFLNFYEDIQFYDAEEFEITFGGGDALRNLLGSLADHDSTTPTPKSRLYAATLEVFQRMNIRLPTQVLDPAPAVDSNEREILQFFHLLIKTNDTSTICQYVSGHRAGLVKAAGIDPERPDWTSLHLAVHYESLDVLNALLNYGVDVEIPNEDGKTPVHLCCSHEYHQDECSLRALLQHGASSIVADKHQMTVWHYGAGYGSTEILSVLVDLVESDERECALQMVSSRNETPICTALRGGSEQCVTLLSKYCNSERYWKSSESMFRAAAQIGSFDVIQALLDAGIEADGMDDDTGSPLHFLSVDSTLECINMLKQLYPVDQRRHQDQRTPFESMLLATVCDKVALDSDILEALLPSTTLSNPSEASILWSFACSKFILASRDSYDPGYWLENLFFFLARAGIARLFEEERNESAIVPFLATTAEEVPRMYETLAGGPNPPPLLIYWRSFSKIALLLARETKYWARVARNPSIIRLLSLSIFHDDEEMITLLVESGVDVHSRVDRLSPFEFACLPDVHIGGLGFDRLLAHATQKGMTQGNESFGGRGPLHLTAGLRSRGIGSIMKLRRLLETGIDCNLPLSATQMSPVAYHILQGAVNTAELLLDFGADPWAAESPSLDAAFVSIYKGNLSLLTRILTMPTDKNHPPRWDRTWALSFGGKLCSGGNALHWAAMFGHVECLKFYLDQDLLSDLEAGDDGLETPMHYAAWFGQATIIEFLAARGGNIDAPSRSGLTPLHLAVRSGQLEAVKTLTGRGAKHQVCHAGCTPLQYAYTTGHSSIIEALGSSSESLIRAERPTASPQKQQALADGLQMAIRQDDVAASERIRALGCSVDIELNHPMCATPLALAIYENRSLDVIQWLLDNGATVSPIALRLRGGYFTVLEQAVTLARYNSLLPRLVTRYVEEGGDILGMHRNPLRLAIETGNKEGFSILLDTIRGVCGRQVNPTVAGGCLLQPNLFSAFVNRREATHFGRTALHVAARFNKLDAVITLISNGANIEEVDGDSFTPLHTAALYGSLEVAKHLLCSGARSDALNTRAQTPAMLALFSSRWEAATLLTETCSSNIGSDSTGRNALVFMTQIASQRDGASHIQTFYRYLDEGVDIHQVDCLGNSAAHWLLASPSAILLRSLLNRDASLLRAHQVAEWPDAAISGAFQFMENRLVTITENLRLVRPFVREFELHRLAGLANPGSHSLLCWATRQGNVEATQNLAVLGMGIMEHECHEHGTPLITAFSYRRTEVVKCLIRNGAKVSHSLFKPRDIEVSPSNPDFVILQWLFVGRFLERRAISSEAANSTKTITRWAGTCTAEVPMKWEWRKMRAESIRQYACRRQKIMSWLRGKVVKVTKLVGKENVSSSQSLGRRV